RTGNRTGGSNPPPSAINLESKGFIKCTKRSETSVLERFFIFICRRKRVMWQSRTNYETNLP
ncbi:MAG: hypothetical protein ACFNP8_03405, partial [Alloprevotella sp.]